LFEVLFVPLLLSFERILNHFHYPTYIVILSVTILLVCSELRPTAHLLSLSHQKVEKVSVQGKFYVCKVLQGKNFQHFLGVKKTNCQEQNVNV